MTTIDIDDIRAALKAQGDVLQRVEQAQKQHARELDELSASVARELGAIRKRLDIDATATATARATALAPTGPASMAPTNSARSRGPAFDTHSALSAVTTGQADGVLATVESLGIWRAKPALVVGFVGAVIALVMTFGVPITKEQAGAILAVVAAGLGLVADARAGRTKKAMVRALTSPSAPESGDGGSAS